MIGFGFSVAAVAHDLAVDRDDTDHADLAFGVAADRHRCRHGLHLVTAGRDRHAESSGASGRRRFRCLQHHPAGRVGARQRKHRGVHVVAHHPPRCRPPRRRRPRAAVRSPSSRRGCTNRSPPRCRRQCCCRRSSRCSASWQRCSCSVSAGGGHLRSPKMTRSARRATPHYAGDETFADDDAYVEYTVRLGRVRTGIGEGARLRTPPPSR